MDLSAEKHQGSGWKWRLNWELSALVLHWEQYQSIQTIGLLSFLPSLSYWGVGYNTMSALGVESSAFFSTTAALIHLPLTWLHVPLFACCKTKNVLSRFSSFYCFNDCLNSANWLQIPIISILIEGLFQLYCLSTWYITALSYYIGSWL